MTLSRRTGFSTKASATPFEIACGLKLMTALDNLMVVPPGQAGESLLNSRLGP